MSIIQPINLASPDPKLFIYAAELLRAGKIVAFPTDTSYGLAVDPRNPAAIKKLYQCKGRLKSKALPLLVSNLAMLDGLTVHLTRAQKWAIKQFWPGPVTIVFEASKVLPHCLLASQDTIAIRYPRATIAKLLITSFGSAVTATSANRSQDKQAPLAPAQIEEQLGSGISLIIDGGKPSNSQSTIIAFRDREVIILRQGVVTEEEIYLKLPKGW